MNFRNEVEKIEFPKNKNVYFERTSIDGYAFLGITKYLLGLDFSKCKDKVDALGIGLNKRWKSRGVPLPHDEVYAYSCYPVYEFYHMIGDETGKDRVIDVMDKIGFYDSGHFRYCKTEINYIVPNVSASAALSFARHGRMDDCKKLINLLRETQNEKGNWNYYTLPENVTWGKEDSSHLSMMVIAMRDLEMEFGIKTSDMVDNAMKDLELLNTLRIQCGSIGWGASYLYLGTMGINEKLCKLAYNECKKSIKSSNFRVRTIASWALAKGEKLWNILSQEE